MTLAWRNLIHDRLRFFVTILGIAFAVFLMVFQASLLVGFLRAAGRVIDASGADIWITARGTPCLDFATPLPARFRGLASGVEGVADVDQLVAGFTALQKPSGVRTTVVCVGADPGVAAGVPLPYVNTDRDSVLPESVVIDESTVDSLGVVTVPIDVEIRASRARVVGVVSDFGTFLGSPYVFTGYEDAKRYIGLGPEQTMFLLVRAEPGQDIFALRQRLRERLPEADVWTREEYAQRASLYWLIQTGAGGSFLTAALLGFLVGLVIVSQNIYATTMEHLEEFATLRALGASTGFIRRVVVQQALASGIAGSALGLAITYPLLAAIKNLISWVYTPWWLPSFMVALTLLMCVMASIVSIRKAVTVEPARVFRA